MLLLPGRLFPNAWDSEYWEVAELLTLPFTRNPSADSSFASPCAFGSSRLASCAAGFFVADAALGTVGALRVDCDCDARLLSWSGASNVNSHFPAGIFGTTVTSA